MKAKSIHTVVCFKNVYMVIVVIEIQVNKKNYLFLILLSVGSFVFADRQAAQKRDTVAIIFYGVHDALNGPLAVLPATQNVDAAGNNIDLGNEIIGNFVAINLGNEEVDLWAE